MNLARFWVLHFFWLLPLAALVLIVTARRKERALARFADDELLARLSPPLNRGGRFLKGLLLLLVLALMLIALAGPRWGSRYQEVTRKGVDIVFVVDLSRSMLVTDVKPSRLEQAKREIADFLKVLEGDRIALVAFAGAPFIQCPLTVDYGAVELFLSALEPGLIPVPGTDLGSAVEKGLAAFDPEAATDRVMVLITDGEDNEGKGERAAERAAAEGVMIFVYGIGDPGGGPIPAAAGRGGFRKDSDGNVILSKLDEEGLARMASLTGGRYVRSIAGDLDLDLVYFSGVKRGTEAREIESGKIRVYEERFMTFLVPAFLLLLLEGFIRERRGLPR